MIIKNLFRKKYSKKKKYIKKKLGGALTKKNRIFEYDLQRTRSTEVRHQGNIAEQFGYLKGNCYAQTLASAIHTVLEYKYDGLNTPSHSDLFKEIMDKYDKPGTNLMTRGPILISKVWQSFIQIFKKTKANMIDYFCKKYEISYKQTYNYKYDNLLFLSVEKALKKPSHAVIMDFFLSPEDMRIFGDLGYNDETKKYIYEIQFFTVSSSWKNLTEISAHSVIVVSEGIANKNGINIPFWLCKNSWGNEWGDNGFFRIAKNVFPRIGYCKFWILYS